MKKVQIKLKENPYPIVIDRGLRSNIASYLKEYNLGNLGFVVTSPKIYELYKQLIKKNFGTSKFKIIKVPNGERAKSKYWLFKIIDEILKFDQANKKPFIICMGGGTVGDLGGFAASIYKRGIKYIQIPTTLVGQIDSSLGGKTAIDLPQAKNIIGSFHQPRAVLIDPEFLNTLPRNQLKEGLAEIIKYAIIQDKKLFSLLRSNSNKIFSLDPALIDRIIYACIKIKAKIVTEDEKERKGIRTILNFGHTFAHGLEAAAEYKRASHGKAVALGMLYAAYLSQNLGKTNLSTPKKIKEILEIYQLPTKTKFNSEKLLKSLFLDKKFNQGKIKMVLVKEIGRVIVSNKITKNDLRKPLSRLNRLTS